MEILEKYKRFLEEHFSREAHNTQEIATQYLTVKATGTFDYVSLEWRVHTDKLTKEYPNVKLSQWSLWGIRHFKDPSTLDAFPDPVDGEIFLKAHEPEGNSPQYLKADVPANFAFFLVGTYSWSTRKTILGPLTLSLTPLRAGTKDIWDEIAELHRLKHEGSPASAKGSDARFDAKMSRHQKLVEEENKIRAMTGINDEEREILLERIRAIYDLFGQEG